MCFAGQWPPLVCALSTEFMHAKVDHRAQFRRARAGAINGIVKDDFTEGPGVRKLCTLTEVS